MALSCNTISNAFLLLVTASIANSHVFIAIAAQTPPKQDTADIQPAADSEFDDTSESKGLNRWYGRVGTTGVFFHPGSTVSAAHSVIPGTAVSVSNRATATFDVGHYFTKNIAASLMVGVPLKSTLSGHETIASYGNLGAMWYGPAMLTTHYHFVGLGALQPYIGGGATYLIVFKKHDESAHDLMVHNSFSPVAQTGTDYMFSKKWGAFVDYKQTWLVVDARGVLNGTIPARTHVKLHPTVITMGISYRF